MTEQHHRRSDMMQHARREAETVNSPDPTLLPTSVCMIWWAEVPPCMVSAHVACKLFCVHSSHDMLYCVCQAHEETVCSSLLCLELQPPETSFVPAAGVSSGREVSILNKFIAFCNLFGGSALVKISATWK